MARSYLIATVQEDCTQCLAVQKLKFEILQTRRKSNTKNINTLHLLIKKLKTNYFIFLGILQDFKT